MERGSVCVTEEEFKSRYKASMFEAYVALLKGGLGKQNIVALDTFEKIANERAHKAWLEYLKDRD